MCLLEDWVYGSKCTVKGDDTYNHSYRQHVHLKGGYVIALSF